MNFLSSLLLGTVVACVATSASAAERQRLDIPGGRLGDALVALGRQAGISIGVADPALADRRVGPVRGNLTVDEALRRLLRGTGARHVAIDSDTFRIVRRPAERVEPRARPLPRPPFRRVPAPVPLPTPLPEPTPIIVTAAKRWVPYGDYPGAIEMIGGETLTLAGVRGSEALVARLPSLTSTHLGPGRDKLFIRGIADSSFTGPTQATVGQYLGESRITYNAPDPDLRLHDLERVEVLAGPQGSLYGAASLGGIIRLIPRAPELGATRAEAAAGVSYTQHGKPGADLSGVLNLPLGADGVGLRLVAYGTSEGGYIDDLLRGMQDVNRTRIAGGRAHLRAIAGTWLIDLGLAGQRIRGDDAQFALRNAPPLTRRSPVNQNFSNDFRLADLVLTRDAGAVRFLGAVGLVRHALRERFDATRSGRPPIVLDQTNRTKLLTVETRLSSGSPEGMNWLIGTSFVHNRSELSRFLEFPAHIAPAGDLINTVSEASLFGEATIPVSSKIAATAGGRIGYTRVSGSAPRALAPSADLSGAREHLHVVPSAAITAKPSGNVLLFLRYQESFRPGGLGFLGGEVRQFRGDDLAAVETGMRYGAPGSPVDAALSLVYTRWADIQADAIDPSGRPVTTNIGNGRIYTVDLRLGWRPGRGIALDAGAVYNESLVTDPSPTIIMFPNSPLPNVARVNARVGANYRTGVGGRFDLELSADARYVGKSRLGIGPVLGDDQGDWLNVGLAARASAGAHTVTLSVTNLFDGVGNRFALGSPFNIGEQRQITPLRPRTLRIGWEFRI